MKHTPVLLQEAIEALQIREGGKYIDATAGQGGHLREMIKKRAEVLAIDRDVKQIENLKQEFGQSSVRLVAGNFSEIERIAVDHGFAQCEGVLFDFGLSWGQLAGSGIGLSYKMPEEPLDMRLDAQADRTAAQALNDYSVQELYEVFSENAEEFHSQLIAEQIVFMRAGKKLEKVADLLNVVNMALKRCSLKHSHGNDVCARVFQAVRVEVNDDFNAIKKGLEGARKILIPGGRIVAIAFHSIEDRIVKNFIKSYSLQQPSRLIKGDRMYRFSRGAKLRVAII